MDLNPFHYIHPDHAQTPEQAAAGTAAIATLGTTHLPPQETTMSTTPVVPVASVHVSFWERVEAKAEALFHMLPKWEVVASEAINTTAPILETILAVEDPALGSVVAPIITTIQTKLAIAGTLIDGLEKNNTLAGLLAGVQADLATILNLAAVKNSSKQSEIAAQVNLLGSVVKSIQNAVSAPLPIPFAPTTPTS